MIIFLLIIFITLNSMEFKIVDFYEDLNNRFTHSFSKINAKNESYFFLIVRTNFSQPFQIDGILKYEILSNFPDTYLFLISSKNNSVTFLKDNYKPKTYKLPTLCLPGSQYVIEIESIEAYFLELKLEPLGGKFTIDGKDYVDGSSIQCGEYEITYSKPDYVSYNETITIDKNNHKFEISLLPIPLSDCVIDTKPTGAKFFINNEFKGYTPFEEKLKKGKYSISFERKKYHNLEKEIEIKQDSNFIHTFSLKPYSFFLTLENQNSVVELRTANKNIINIQNDSLSYFTDLAFGDYSLRISNPEFSPIKKKFTINDTLIFDQHLVLKKNILKTLIQFRDKKAFVRKNHIFSYLQYQTTFHKINDLKYNLLAGFEFKYFFKRDNIRNVINPFLAINLISLIENQENYKWLISPFKTGLDLNILGDTKFNAKPKISLDYIPIINNDWNISAKNWGISYGIGIEYWLSNNIGINFSYEKSKNMSKNKYIDLPIFSEMTSYKTGISYILSSNDTNLSNKKEYVLDRFSSGYDELLFLAGSDKNSLDTTIIGWEFNPRLNDFDENKVVLPLLSLKALTLLSKYNKLDEAHLYMTNFGLKLKLFSGRTKFLPFGSVGWAPYSVEENKNFYSNLYTNSYSWNVGFTINHRFNNFAGISLGTEYITFFNKNNTNSSDGFQFSNINEIIIAKAGINFEIDDFYVMNRQLNDLNFTFTQNSFKEGFFNENYGIEISKYFIVEKSMVQIIKTSVSQFKNRNDVMYLANINYGLGINLFANSYYCGFIPFCAVGWEPLVFDFAGYDTNPYIGNSTISGRELNNFSWNGGIDLKINFSKIGFIIGYEFSKSFNKIVLNPNSKIMKTDSDKLKIGFFF